MPHQAAVDKAQHPMRKGRYGEMGIKVRRGAATHAQEANEQGGAQVWPPEHGGASQRPCRQRDASHQAGFEQLATTNTSGLVGILCVHKQPSLALIPLAVKPSAVLLLATRSREVQVTCTSS